MFLDFDQEGAEVYKLCSQIYVYGDVCHVYLLDKNGETSSKREEALNYSLIPDDKDRNRYSLIKDDGRQRGPILMNGQRIKSMYSAKYYTLPKNEKKSFFFTTSSKGRARSFKYNDTKYQWRNVNGHIWLVNINQGYSIAKFSRNKLRSFGELTLAWGKQMEPTLKWLILCTIYEFYLQLIELEVSVGGGICVNYYQK